MPFLSTTDEKYTGNFILRSAGAFDAPTSFSNNAYKIGQYQTAYGALVILGYTPDIDTYAIGTLNSGSVTVSASSYTWDYFSNLDGDGFGWSYYTPSIFLYNSAGQQVASGFGSVSYSINYLQAGDFYVSVKGSSYLSSQYQLSYSYVAPFNYLPTNSTLLISGTGEVGSRLSISGNWTDANGTTIVNHGSTC